jgi:hypothetical protein
MPVGLMWLSRHRLLPKKAMNAVTSSEVDVDCLALCCEALSLIEVQDGDLSAWRSASALHDSTPMQPDAFRQKRSGTRAVCRLTASLS